MTKKNYYTVKICELAKQMSEIQRGICKVNAKELLNDHVKNYPIMFTQIFGYLYLQYRKEKERVLKKSKNVSCYDYENLMYSLLDNIIAENNYTNLGSLIYR